jgi:hypothetical protein
MGRRVESASDGVVVRRVPVPNTWEGLFRKALRLIDDIERHGVDNLFWTFGGGTVLMLRYRHRHSKDIDIFVPDPQVLGFVTPRLSDEAERITTKYTEAAGHVKLFLEAGEIDFVAAPNLTDDCYQLQTLLGREVRVETSAEIIAKKFWHRGDQLAARDIFDFALVAEKEPKSVSRAAKFFVRHADAIYRQLSERATPLKKQFEAIDALSYHPRFEDACEILRSELQRSQSRLAMEDEHRNGPRRG